VAKQKVEEKKNTTQKNMKRIFLFDVDGTLTVARKKITTEMSKFLKDLRKNNLIGFVGGSDLCKQKEQLGNDVLMDFDYAFPENGLVAYKDGKLLQKENLANFLSEDKLKKLINVILHYIADLEIPVKRGTFIEFRTGMLNVSPIGRNCSYQERLDFYAYDQENNIRQTMIDKLTPEFKNYGLQTSIGGQISFDVFPIGWDKTFCLPFLQQDGITEIHFFGDKTYQGGNDYEIFQSDNTIGHTVKSPDETRDIITKILHG